MKSWYRKTLEWYPWSWLVLALFCVALDACDDPEPERSVASGLGWAPIGARLTPRGDAAQVVARLKQRARAQPAFFPYPAGKQATVARADTLLRRVAEPGQALEALEPPLDWGGARNEPEAGAERNSLRALRPLMAAHRATAQPRYLDYMKRVLLDWTQYNLVDKRKNELMWHGMATGQRALLFAYVIDQELRRPSSDSDEFKMLLWAALQHADALANPRLFSESNHGFYMVEGLKALVRVLPELKDAQKFTAYAHQQLRHLLVVHFGDDGFHREHSPEYHLLATQLLERLAQTGLFDELGALKKTLTLAESHSYQLFHPNGERLTIGDSSRGTLRRHGLARAHERFIESEGRDGTRPPAGLHAYPGAGYVFFRSTFDVHPFVQHSYLFFAPGYHSSHHKHADHLSFEWSEAGQSILVNGGKFESKDQRWREFFMSTRAGNAVEVDQKDYSLLAGKPWGGGLSSWGALGDIQTMRASVTHEKLGVAQVRTLLLLPRRWLCVIDQLSADETHTYRQWFHFHERFEVGREGAGFIAKSAGGPSVRVQATSSDGTPDAQYAHGQREPRLLGYLSPDGRTTEARASIAFRKAGKSLALATFFSLAQGPVRLTLTGNAARLSLTVNEGPQTWRFVIDPKGVSLE